MKVVIDKNLDLDKILQSGGLTTKNITGELGNELANIYRSHNARNIRSIVYIFRANSDIPRLKGKSPIFYIGQSKNSLYERYNITTELKEYSDRYQHIIDSYGGFTVSIFQTEQPEYLESILLWKYRKNHLEYPPLNLTTYKVGYINDFLIINNLNGLQTN